MVTLRQLEYFVALAETGHFGRAAERCHVSQPALSMQVRQMEDRLGAPLPERRRKDVLLTRTGRAVLAEARQMLAAQARIVQLCHHEDAPLAGPLVMGVIPTIAPYMVPSMVPRLATDFPQMQLYLREEQTEHILDKLIGGSLDIGLLALPINNPDLVETTLFEEEFVVAMARNDPLARRKSLKIRDLRTNDPLLLEEGHCLRDQAMDICRLPEYAPYGASFRATSLETLKCMVADGLGLTLLPRMAVGANDHYITRPFQPPAPTRKVGLIWRRSNPRGAEFTRLAQAMREMK